MDFGILRLPLILRSVFSIYGSLMLMSLEMSHRNGCMKDPFLMAELIHSSYLSVAFHFPVAHQEKFKSHLNHFLETVLYYCWRIPRGLAWFINEIGRKFHKVLCLFSWALATYRLAEYFCVNNLWQYLQGNLL